MENNATYPLWKLIFQKSKLSLVFISVIAVAVVALSMSGNFCGIQHMSILNDIKTYEQSLDPEYCEQIVERIDLFNDQCEPEIEILDCG